MEGTKLENIPLVPGLKVKKGEKTLRKKHYVQIPPQLYQGGSELPDLCPSLNSKHTNSFQQTNGDRCHHKNKKSMYCSTVSIGDAPQTLEKT